MSAKSFSASERRGVIALALIALLITGVGIGISFFERNSQKELPEIEEIVNQPDSTAKLKDKKEKSHKKKKSKSKGRSKSKIKKTYRKRSPLDETV